MRTLKFTKRASNHLKYSKVSIPTNYIYYTQICEVYVVSFANRNHLKYTKVSIPANYIYYTQICEVYVVNFAKRAII